LLLCWRDPLLPSRPHSTESIGRRAIGLPWARSYPGRDQGHVPGSPACAAGVPIRAWRCTWRLVC